MFTYGRRIRCRRIRCRLQTRPTPLLGLIHSRRLRRSAARQLDGRLHVMSALGGDMLPRAGKLSGRWRSSDPVAFRREGRCTGKTTKARYSWWSEFYLRLLSSICPSSRRNGLETHPTVIQNILRDLVVVLRIKKWFKYVNWYFQAYNHELLKTFKQKLMQSVYCEMCFIFTSYCAKMRLSANFRPNQIRKLTAFPKAPNWIREG